MGIFFSPLDDSGKWMVVYNKFKNARSATSSSFLFFVRVFLCSGRVWHQIGITLQNDFFFGPSDKMRTITGEAPFKNGFVIFFEISLTGNIRFEIPGNHVASFGSMAKQVRDNCR